MYIMLAGSAGFYQPLLPCRICLGVGRAVASRRWSARQAAGVALLRLLKLIDNVLPLTRCLVDVPLLT